MCQKCGCNTCEAPIQGPLLTEGKVKSLISENLQYHIDKNIPLFESIFRIGSNSHLSLIKEARKLYSRDLINLSEDDTQIIKTHLGEFAIYEGESVPLDLPMLEAEYQGRDVDLNKPKRGGPKKFYVYVKNPKTGRVKKISWGDTTGLSVKANDRGAVRSFVARHKCKQANDKMTARYWSCRTPRYKALGVKGGQWW